MTRVSIYPILTDWSNKATNLVMLDGRQELSQNYKVLNFKLKRQAAH